MVPQGQFQPQHTWQQQHAPHNNTPLGPSMCPTSTPVVGGLDEAPKNRGSVLVPCRARGMPMDHNFKTAHFVIPENIEHGAELLCSYPSCRNAGVKFRFCTVCQVPVAKRNFRKRHMHANGDNAEEKLSDDEVDITAFARPCTPKQLASPGNDATASVKRSWSGGVGSNAEQENEREWASLLSQRPSTDDNDAMSQWLLKVLTVSDAAKRLKKNPEETKADSPPKPTNNTSSIIEEVIDSKNGSTETNKGCVDEDTIPEKPCVEKEANKTENAVELASTEIVTSNPKIESNKINAIKGNSANQDIHLDTGEIIGEKDILKKTAIEKHVVKSAAVEMDLLKNVSIEKDVSKKVEEKEVTNAVDNKAAVGGKEAVADVENYEEKNVKTLNEAPNSSHETDAIKPRITTC
mmetsp:Transcript_12596/g.27843  ORF Transcript_12596/g.27843 Transcript_12596/m.27843 type:complete len:407 (+) Transcript_12596:1172-2392(+)|eukprot:CAMPEP_0113309662 /NCGR_PEP_ID=MMETSP0010_2-20120614/7615_1 /TAXON_ID=216773 ORGANISM="Corethron hystrix, Strain 308" /NCGR_SAMPLE_ID=MMETSP0010_2 /ASSEMBLY_ACC=CAM_ASM_000155 /LENGTH=406 /DNA_ID=CAMNT_0000164957 /DNA_START=528 /DNA_END=1748 /DNA_ORIENTATION=- /assembly_acc=CAM_ASM_000155